VNVASTAVRFRPTLPWPATASNLMRACKHLARIKAQIEAGTFCFAEVFPDYKGLVKVPARARTRSCGDVFGGWPRVGAVIEQSGALLSATG
jgi:hypothetical protein